MLPMKKMTEEPYIKQYCLVMQDMQDTYQKSLIYFWQKSWMCYP